MSKLYRFWIDARQRKTKTAPFSPPRLDPDFTVMRLYNSFRNRKPQPRAAGLARARLFPAIKLLKDARHISFGNSLPRINHVHLHLRALIPRARLDKNR